MSSKLLLRSFVSNESGATLIEYGVALIVAIVVGGISLVNLANGTNEAIYEAETVQPDEGLAIDWQDGFEAN